MDGLGAAPENHGVSRLEAEGGGIHRDVGPGFIDDADHPQGDAHPTYQQAVGTAPHGGDLAHGIVEGRHLVASRGHRRNGRFLKSEAIDHRRRQALFRRRGYIPGIFLLQIRGIFP